jgi:hypothetical protein
VRYCPNPECAHLARSDGVAEFLDTVEFCSDCGTSLRQGEAPPKPAKPAPAYRELETVYETSDRIQAHLIRSLLEQDEIAVHVAGESLHGALGELPPTMPYVRVQVPPEHVERARRLITERDEETARAQRDETGSPGGSAKRTSRGINRSAAFLLGMILGAFAATAYWRESIPRAPESISPAPRPGHWDRNGDGRQDTWARYGTDGIMVESSYDENLDGSADLWYALGEAEQPTAARYDTDFDGQEDYWEDYEDGVATSYSADNDRDGTRDEWGKFERAHVASERLWSFRNDAIIDKRAVYKNGRRVQEQYDRDRDRRFDETLDLDEFERVIRRDAAE